MKIDADEKELLESVERGEWKSAGGGKRERARYSRYAKATFRKDRRLNIRLSSKDLEAIQKRALAEGLPYQTLISSLLHKYASGRLEEVLPEGRRAHRRADVFGGEWCCGEYHERVLAQHLEFRYRAWRTPAPAGTRTITACFFGIAGARCGWKCAVE